MARFTRRILMNSLLGATLIVLASCGGGSSSTAEPDETGSSASAATDAPSTVPATTVPPIEVFDGAVAEAFRAGLALAELRLACLEITDLSCFISSEQSIGTAEKEVAAALESVAAAADQIGVNSERCQEPIAEVVKNNSTEWASLLVRARDEGSGTKRFGEPDWEHHRKKIGAEINTPGHAIAGVLLGCIDVAKDRTELNSKFAAFVLSSDLARLAFSYNLLTQYLCVDQPVDPSLPDSTCFGMLGSPDDVGFGRGNLEYAYGTLTSEPRHAEMPQECRDAIEEANTRLMSSLDIFNNLDQRELVSTDTELLSLVSLGVFQIDDQRRGTAPMYPFDEVMALKCASAAAEIA